MAFGYKFRDLRRPRMEILREVGVKQGFHVLDYGCGPGSYLLPLAELVGDSGRIYALDANPLAVATVEGLAAKNGLANFQAILSDRETGLPAGSVDVVLLYDILHHLKEHDKVLAELHRVLKPGGVLSVNDHHLKKDEIISRTTGNGLFTLSIKGVNAINFVKKNQ
jgi:ubiquinone/menaquinone biosynthesis C-methylase UbiE